MSTRDQYKEVSIGGIEGGSSVRLLAPIYVAQRNRAKKRPNHTLSGNRKDRQHSPGQRQNFAGSRAPALQDFAVSRAGALQDLADSRAPALQDILGSGPGNGLWNEHFVKRVSMESSGSIAGSEEEGLKRNQGSEVRPRWSDIKFNDYDFSCFNF